MKNPIAQHCLEQILAGKTALIDVAGQRRLLVTLLRLDHDPDPLLCVGLEGKALRLFKPGEEVEQFDLVSSGFPLHIALAVCELVDDLLSIAADAKIETTKESTLTERKLTLES